MDQYYSKMQRLFMNTENIKTDKPHRFRSTLADKHKDPNKIWHWPV